MIKFFQKPTSKWTWTAVIIFMSLGLVGFTNSISNGTPATGVSTPKQTPQSNQSSSVPDGRFDYQTYLPFTPLLPSYTAGYQLIYSQIACNQNVPPGNNSSKAYSAIYGSGSHSEFGISETIGLKGMDSYVSAHSTKTQIQIGDLSATLYVDKKIDAAHIQFTKNDVEYSVSSIPGGGVSLDDLKKISVSIAVPADTPPTDIHILKMGLTASDEKPKIGICQPLSSPLKTVCYYRYFPRNRNLKWKKW